MNLNELRDKAYKIACDHGFHDKELSKEHFLCLVISELMKAVEADRKGRKPLMGEFECGISYPKNDFKQVYDYCIKGSVAEELADAVIRLLDLAGLRGINLECTNLCIDETAEACKDETFTESIYEISVLPARYNGQYDFDTTINDMIMLIFGLAKHLDIDLFWHIEQKMKYNQSRERLHGKSIESMRTIKFRGKRTDNGEWVFGDLIHGVGSKYGRMYILPVTHIYPKGCNELDGWQVTPETVGQFTGLLDKNGKEIYEGDILNNGQRNYFVSWNEERGAWWLKNKDLIYTQPLGFLSAELFVIGSVHDNPELLKGGEE